MTREARGNEPTFAAGRRWRRAAVICFASTLSACVPTAGVEAPTYGPASVTVAPSPSPSAMAEPRPTQVPSNDGLLSPVAAAVAPASEPPPVDLNGMSRTALNELLGRPAFVRRDGPAEIWRYDADGCILDVFLYVRGGTLNVAHYEAREEPKAGQARPAIVDAVDCVRAIRALRAPELRG